MCRFGRSKISFMQRLQRRKDLKLYFDNLGYLLGIIYKRTGLTPQIQLVDIPWPNSSKAENGASFLPRLLAMIYRCADQLWFWVCA